MNSREVEHCRDKQLDRTEDYRKLEPRSEQEEVTFNQVLTRYPDYNAVLKLALRKLKRFFTGQQNI